MPDTPRDRAREASRQARLRDIKRELANAINDREEAMYSSNGGQPSVTGRTLTPDVAKKNADLVAHARKTAIEKRKMDREGTAPKKGLVIREDKKRPLKDI